MNMKRMNLILSFLSVFGIPLMSARAADTVPWSMTYGIDFSSNSQKNAKFNEYRYARDEKAGVFLQLKRNLASISDDPDGKYSKYYNANAKFNPFAVPEGATRYMNVDIQARTPKEANLNIASGSYGIYKFNIGVTRMGHNFAFDARTLYSGNKSGDLTLSDAIQTDIQNTAAATRDDKLNTYLNTSSSRIDMSLKRDKIRVDLQRLSAGKPVTTNLFWDQEFRNGSRPYGASFGHGSAVEIPEPIDYGTMTFGGNTEYASKDLYANLSFMRSMFKNDLPSVRFDNPVIAADSTAGSAAGRNALPPNNVYDNLTLFLSKTLTDLNHTRATARASFGRMRQDENLLPMSNNSAYDTAVPSYAQLGTARAGLKIDKRQYDVSLASELTENFNVKASFSYDQHKNKSPFFNTPKFLAYDGSISKAGETTTYVSYIERTTELEAELEINPRTDATLTFEREISSFRNGSANHERENIYQLTLNRRMDLFSTRLVLERSAKRTDYPNYPKWSGEVPSMRKYYAASRDRSQITAMFTATPTEKATMNLEYLYGNDAYAKSTYGLRGNRHSMVGLNADYQFDDRTTLNAFYSFEFYKSLQRSHAWSADKPTDPHAYPDTYNQNNSWTLTRTDRWRTFGASISSVLVENVLDLTVTGSVSRVNGMADYDSPAAPAPPADFQQIDETHTTALEARMNYHVPNKPTTVTFGYRYDKWRIYDFQYDGVQEVLESNTGSYLGLLNMNTLSKNYGGVHSLYASVNYLF